jgi:hypothetical protein
VFVYSCGLEMLLLSHVSFVLDKETNDFCVDSQHHSVLRVARVVSWESHVKDQKKHLTNVSECVVYDITNAKGHVLLHFV